MLAHLLALAGDRTPVVPLPAVSALSLTPNPGYCNFDSIGDKATITLGFSVTNPGDGYELRVLESGALQDTLPVTATEWVYSTPMDVENAGQSQQVLTFAFAVQLVRTADGVVMQEVTNSYTGTYGICR